MHLLALLSYFYYPFGKNLVAFSKPSLEILTQLTEENIQILYLCVFLFFTTSKFQLLSFLDQKIYVAALAQY